MNVTNNGNSPVNTEIAFRDQDGELTFNPPGGATTLPPGANIDYSVRINGPHRWFGRTQRHPFSAVLTPAGPHPPITLNGTRQQTAVFPWWIPTAAFALIAIAIALFAVSGLRGPTIPATDTTLDETAAINVLKKAEYTPQVLKELSDTVPKGKWTKTDPMGGMRWKKGDPVKLFISLGKCADPCPKIVPDTESLIEETAKTALMAEGFTVGDVQRIPNDLEKGRVIRTNPGQGTMADLRKPVIMIVSSGPNTKLTPQQLLDFQGKSASAIAASLGPGNVKTRNKHSNEYAAGKVIEATQDPNNPQGVILIVAVPTATDLVGMASKAKWKSSAGPLTFPGNVTDAQGAVLLGKTNNKVLGTIPPNTGTKSITGLFTLSPDQKIISGDHLMVTIGLVKAGATGPVQFTVKIGGQLALTRTVEPGQQIPIDESLDAFVGASTIEVSVTGDPSSGGSPLELAPSPGGAAATATANQAFWQNLHIAGVPPNR
ncbi:MAG: PASTA domain-containing protein [Pseudonocardiaceae bacterium]